MRMRSIIRNWWHCCSSSQPSHYTFLILRNSTEHSLKVTQNLPMWQGYIERCCYLENDRNIYLDMVVTSWYVHVMANVSEHQLYKQKLVRQTPSTMSQLRLVVWQITHRGKWGDELQCNTWQPCTCKHQSRGGNGEDHVTSVQSWNESPKMRR